MKKLILFVLFCFACQRSAPVPDHKLGVGTEAVVVADPTNPYMLSLDDAGRPTVNLNGSVTIGSNVTVNGTVDAGVNINNTPSFYLADGSVVVTNTVSVQGTIDANVAVSSLPALPTGTNTIGIVKVPYGTWHDFPNTGTAVMNEGGVTLYGFECQSHDGTNAEYVFIQNQSTSMTTEAGPNPYSYLLPAAGSIIYDQNYFGNGRSFATGITFGVSSAANGYYAVSALPDCQFNFQ